MECTTLNLMVLHNEPILDYIRWCKIPTSDDEASRELRKSDF